MTFRSWVIPVNYWTDGLDSNQAVMYQDITWLCDRSWNRAEQKLGPRKSMLKAIWRIKCIGKYLPFMTLSVKHTWWRKRRWCPNVAIMAWKESFGDWEQEALETENRKLLSAESLELLPGEQCICGDLGNGYRPGHWVQCWYNWFRSADS